MIIDDVAPSLEFAEVISGEVFGIAPHVSCQISCRAIAVFVFSHHKSVKSHVINLRVLRNQKSLCARTCAFFGFCMVYLLVSCFYTFLGTQEQCLQSSLAAAHLVCSGRCSQSIPWEHPSLSGTVLYLTMFPASFSGTSLGTKTICGP